MATAENKSEQTVLVTGGSGYIGAWTIVRLLEQGYRVRTTVRSLDREAKVRANIAEHVNPGDRLTFFAADLLNDAGWEEATKGVDYVLHVASPLGVGEDKNIDLVPPARDGTLRVLRASTKAGVKRVVLTSSGSAALPAGSTDTGVKADETVWTDPTAKGVDNYSQSKTLAEQAAWDFIKREGGNTTLTTVLPVFVEGPVLGKDLISPSVELVSRLVSGKLPGIIRLGMSIVDVRDVADLHILAMTAPEAAGQRFIGTSDFLWMADMATILRGHLGAKGAKIPTRRLPDILFKVMALFNSEARQLAPRLGKHRELSSAKAIKVLGWQPRSAATTMMDCADSLIKTGLV